MIDLQKSQKSMNKLEARIGELQVVSHLIEMALLKVEEGNDDAVMNTLITIKEYSSHLEDLLYKDFQDAWTSTITQMFEQDVPN